MEGYVEQQPRRKPGRKPKNREQFSATINADVLKAFKEKAGQGQMSVLVQFLMVKALEEMDVSLPEEMLQSLKKELCTMEKELLVKLQSLDLSLLKELKEEAKAAQEFANKFQQISNSVAFNTDNNKEPMSA